VASSSSRSPQRPQTGPTPDNDRFVRVVEVGPRDGLQNERVFVDTAAKVRFVETLADAGLRDVEVSSFVHPKAVPQLRDAEDVFAQLRRRPGVRYSALVPNLRGLERALRCELDEIAVFTGSTDSFVGKNIRMTIAESLERFAPVVPAALDAGLTVRGYVSTAFGCPYEGEVRPEQGIRVAEALFAMGCREVSIGDTIGVGTPGAVHRWLEAAAGRLPFDRLALHFHDTRGQALANVLAALEHGVRVFDASAGGLGGCPYAPGASGNLATEDLVYCLHGSGWETGIALDGLLEATRAIAGQLDHILPGRYFQAERVRGVPELEPLHVKGG
jgi:hydroxymethylglutaryl-CoA lyase